MYWLNLKFKAIIKVFYFVLTWMPFDCGLKSVGYKLFPLCQLVGNTVRTLVNVFTLAVSMLYKLQCLTSVYKAGLYRAFKFVL